MRKLLGWVGLGCWSTGPRCSHLGSGLDLVLADETLLDPRRAQRAGGDVAARPEQSVSLHVRAHHALLQRLNVAVEGRAAGAHLAAGGGRGRAYQKQERSRRNRERENIKVKNLIVTALAASLYSKMQCLC